MVKHDTFTPSYKNDRSGATEVFTYNQTTTLTYEGIAGNIIPKIINAHQNAASNLKNDTCEGAFAPRPLSNIRFESKDSNQ